MKNTKRLLAIVLTLAMLVPMFVVSVSADALSDENWNTFSAKYTTAGAIITDENGVVLETGFEYLVNEDGGIEMIVPDSTAFAGTYPVAVVSSNASTPLDNLTATVTPSSDFVFVRDGNNASSTISMLWTQEKIASLSGLDTAKAVYTGGIRGLGLENDKAGMKGLAVTISNSFKDYSEKVGSDLSITLYKGDSFIDETNDLPGYTWKFTSRNNIENGSTMDQSGIKVEDYCEIGVAEGVTFYIRPDTALGYVVIVNGAEYYRGEPDPEPEEEEDEDSEEVDPDAPVVEEEKPFVPVVGYFPNDTGELGSADFQGDTDKYLNSMTYAKDDIDLSSLKGSSGYLSFAITGTNATSADLTVNAINNIPAAEWAGEALDHSHNFVELEDVAAECLTDGYTKYQCDYEGCTTKYTLTKVHPGHHWVVYKELLETCTESGIDYKRCVVCGATEEAVVAATGHDWTEFEVIDESERATPDADGTLRRHCRTCGEAESKSYKYSDADKIADNWFVSGENRYTAGGYFTDGVIFTTVNDDGSITLKDTVAQYDVLDTTTQCSYNNITKITSLHKSQLNGFTATVTMLPATSTNELRPDSVSFLWTNQVDNYRFAGQYSGGMYFWLHENLAGNKFAGKPLGSTKEDSRLGYMWDNYVEYEEYSYNLTLNDAVVLWGSYEWGVEDDNMYDFLVYTSICRGDLWNNSLNQLEVSGDSIDATQPITVEACYEYVEDEDASVLAYKLNGKYFVCFNFANSQTYEQVYHFSVAAYADGVNKCGAAFTLNDVCGEKPVDFDGYVDADACQHEWSDWEWVPEGKEFDIPTCTNKGQMFKTCELCWASEYRSIPKTEHSYEEIKVIKAPTCLEDGEGELHCVACTSKKENVVIPATGVHLWGDWEITKEATATEHGEGTRVCSTCLETETVIHYYEDEGYYSVEPTCGTSGILVRHCVVCDQDIEEVVAPVGEHLWGPWEETKAPNCGYRGARVRKCLVCADIAEKLVILDNYNLVEHTYSPAMIGDYVETRGEHVYDEGKETASTCKMKGYKVYTCEVCERTKEETLPLKDHTWIETIVEATCTTEGSITRVCDVCRATESEVIPMHVAPVDENGDIVYTRIQTQPTCDTTGVAAYTCTVCNRPVRVELPALGHTWGDWTTVKDPTCIATGTQTHTCEVCGTSADGSIAKVGHPYGDPVVVPATCTEDGTSTITCTYCGAQKIEKLKSDGHAWGEWVEDLAPTCAVDGASTITCSACEISFTKVVAATGEHTWGEWVVTTEPTVDEYGEETRTCSVCGAEETRRVDKLEEVVLENPFIDVPDGQWYTEGILFCYQKGYMEGTGTDEATGKIVFNRKGLVDRQQFATILAAVAGADTTEYTTSSFADVETGKWYSAAIEWAYQNGYAAGTGADANGTPVFGRKANVTRETLAQFFYTYSKLNGIDVSAEADLSAYTDLDRVHGWALDAVEWAVAEGLISGTTTTTLAPRGNASRAEIAIIIESFVENVLN